MKPAPFDYHAPRQLKEAAELLATLPNAKILAGGQSLVPMMNFRYVVADHLVDLGGISDLRGIAVGDGRLRIGAMMRQRELETAPEVAQAVPLLAAALPLIGHEAIRNRGTIGGSLAHADPAAELPAVARALDAEFVVRSTSGTRVMGTSSVIGTLSWPQRFQRGGINGPRIQSPVASPAGLRRTPRNPGCAEISAR